MIFALLPCLPSRPGGQSFLEWTAPQCREVERPEPTPVEAEESIGKDALQLPLPETHVPGLACGLTSIPKMKNLHYRWLDRQMTCVSDVAVSAFAIVLS